MKTQFVTDKSGKKINAILPIKDYEKILEELEEFNDIKLYAQAKKEDDSERILLSDYKKQRNF